MERDGGEAVSGAGGEKRGAQSESAEGRGRCGGESPDLRGPGVGLKWKGVAGRCEGEGGECEGGLGWGITLGLRHGLE